MLPSDDDPAMHDRLADVYRRADRLRRQRRQRLVGAAVVVAAVALVAVVAFPGLGDDDPDLTVHADDPAGDGATTTTTDAGGTTTTAGDGSPTTTLGPGSGPRSGPADPPPPADGPTTTTVVCRNSTDPSCGPFRWDPAPENRPATIEVEVQAAASWPSLHPFFDVTVRDDGRGEGACRRVDFGDGTVIESACAPSCSPGPERFGPWHPPPPGDFRVDEVLDHTYERPGRYTVTFEYHTGAACDGAGDPYADTARHQLTYDTGG